MSGRRGKRAIPVAMAIAIAAQMFPAAMFAGDIEQLRGLSLDINEPLSAQTLKEEMPGMKPKASKPVVMDKAGGLELTAEKAPVQVSAPAVIEKAAVAAPAAKAPAKISKTADDATTVYTMQQLDESEEAQAPSKTLQGTVTSINVTRGRSQIVKFAQPIMRMSIAQPDIADVIPLAPDQIMINGKIRGVTSLIVWDENGQEGIFDLYVQNDTSELMEAVKEVAPSEKIQARVTDDSFILTGQVSNSVILDEIRKTAAAYGYRDDKFVDLTDTPVPQVMLEVKIVEASRSTLRDFRSGIGLSNTTGNTRGGISRFDTLGPGSPPPPPTIGGLLPNLPNPSVGGWTANLTRTTFGKVLNLRLDALETSGKINTLANPSLVCTHGRSASFLAGGEFPFVGSVDSNGSPIISFKEFGVKLNFTPWIAIKSGRIELKIEPEVSNLDSSNCVTGAAGSQVCGILKRTTNTTVELNDGETLMISGILSREEQNTFAKTPFIGNVPILGNMFKNGDMSKVDRELVVIVTPHIVKPTDYGKILGAAQ